MKKWIFLSIFSVAFNIYALEQAQPELNVAAPLDEISSSDIQARSPVVEAEEAIEESVHQELPETAYHHAKKPSKGCTCFKKCFSHCKFLDQAVKTCEIRGATPISFRIHCECRNLKEGERLPSFYEAPKSCLIKPAQSYVDQD